VSNPFNRCEHIQSQKYFKVEYKSVKDISRVSQFIKIKKYKTTAMLSQNKQAWLSNLFLRCI